jgi:hypothetical protein
MLMTPVNPIVGVSILRPQMAVAICSGPTPPVRSHIWSVLWNVCLALALVILVLAVCAAATLSHSTTLATLAGYATGAIALMVFLAYKRA